MFKLKTILAGHQNPIYSLTLAEKNNRLFSAGADKGIVEWNLETEQFQSVFAPIKQSAFCIYSFEDYIAISERLGRIQIYHLADGRLISEFQAGDKAVFALLYIPHKAELISIGEDGIMRIWNPLTGLCLSSLQISDIALRGIAFNAPYNLITIGDKRGKIYVIHAADFSVLHHFEAHTMGLTSLVFMPENNILLSGSRDAQLKIWNAINFELIKSIPAHMNTIYGIVMHPYLPILATASQDKSIKIWHSEDFRLLKILSLEKSGEGHRHTVNSICWDQTGKLLISASDDRQIILWELSE